MYVSIYVCAFVVACVYKLTSCWVCPVWYSNMLLCEFKCGFFLCGIDFVLRVVDRGSICRC